MFFTRGCVGVDIGPKFIKAVHMLKHHKGFSMENAMKIENPIEKLSFFEEREKELMAKCLSKIREFPCRSVVIGVSNRHIAFRNIQLPKLTKKELEEAIYWESQEFSSVFNGEFVSDYHIVEENPNYLKVFLAGAEKKHVQNLSDIAKIAGLRLVALDAYPLAVERLLNLKTQDRNVAMLDIGPHDSYLTILEKGKLFSLRHIPLGCNSIDGDKSMGGLCEGDVETLEREIEQFFHYFSLQTQGQRVELLLLSGEAAGVSLIEDLLSRKLQIKVTTVASLNFDFNTKTADIDYDIDYIEYFNAIGFAMRG